MIAPEPNAIRVIVVDDHTLVLAGIVALVDRLPGIQVIGTARDGRGALSVVAQHLPDILLLDISLPEVNGLQVLARVTMEFPGVRVIMLTMHDSEDYVGQALRSGAAGYLLKTSSPTELEVAIRSVHQGGRYLSPFVSQSVVDGYVRRGTPEQSALERITARQREIVQMIAEGRTNVEIANILCISVKTVEYHRSQVMDRLKLHDLAGVVRFAVRTGLVAADG